MKSPKNKSKTPKNKSKSPKNKSKTSKNKSKSPKKTIKNNQKGKGNESDQWIGFNIHGYKLEKLIGQGQFGSVYIAKNIQQSNSNEMYIVKIIKRQYYNDNETKILKEVSEKCYGGKASFINHYKYSDEYDNMYDFIISKYLENSIDLFDYINLIYSNNHIEDPKIFVYNNLIIIKHLLLQLKCLHQNSIIHLDIKPENILIQLNEKKIVTYATFIDFGLSCNTDIYTYNKANDKNVKCKSSGTLEYMAPEILNIFKKNDIKGPNCIYSSPLSLSEYKKTDIWSLGITFYLLITNKLPHESLYHSKYTERSDIIFDFYKNIDKSVLNVSSVIRSLDTRDKYYNMYKEYYDYVNELLQNMLKYNPCERKNAEEL
jgi:serine/threonine protein kinase